MPDKKLPQDEQKNPMNDVNRAEFLERMDQQLNDSELRELCFKLGVDYENLAPGGKKDKARDFSTNFHSACRGRAGRGDVGRSKWRWHRPALL